jgi:hypothetical protein
MAAIEQAATTAAGVDSSCTAALEHLALRFMLVHALSSSMHSLLRRFVSGRYY